jgi:hypothetical protein
MSRRMHEGGKTAGFDTPLQIFYLTVLAYIAAFGYQAAYLGHFGLSPDYAEVDLKQLLIAFGFLTAIVGSVWVGSDAAAHMWSQLQAPRVWGGLLSRVLAVLFIVLAGWLNEQRWYFTLGIVFPIVVNLFFQFIVPIFVRGRATYTQRVDQWITHSDELEGKGLRVAIERFGPVANRVFNAIVTLAIAGMLGQVVARFQDVFLVSLKTPPCIVIRTSATGFLCEAFDRKSHELAPRYRFIEEKEADFTSEKLGSFAKAHPAVSSGPESPGSVSGVKAVLSEGAPAKPALPKESPSEILSAASAPLSPKGTD